MVPANQVPQAFSGRDAQDLIALAQNAPLANLHQAKVVDQLCLRAQMHFAQFFAAGKQPGDKAPEQEAPAAGGKKRKGNGNGESAGASDPLA